MMDSVLKGGAGAFAVAAGGLLIAAIALIVSIGGSVSGWVAMPVAIAAFIILRRSGDRTTTQAGQASSFSPTRASVGDILDGVNSTIEIRQNGVAISRKGPVGFLVYGIKGEKLLPFKSITSVQFKEPGKQMAGYIQFGLQGGIESARGIVAASGDENTVLFERKNHAAFLGLRHLVEERISSEVPASTTRITPAEQLQTIAQLYETGHMTAEELASEKTRILSR